MNCKAIYTTGLFLLLTITAWTQVPKVLSSELTVQQGASGQELPVPGMRLSFQVEIPPQAEGKIRWEIRAPRKGLVYQSRQSQHPSVRWIPLGEAGKQTINLWADYQEIQLDEAGEVEIRILVEESDGKEKEIWRKTQFLALPKKYGFEDQYVVAEHADTRVVVQDGVAGLQVSMTLKFKLTGPRKDPERGDYVFFLNINDATGRALLHHYEVNMPETHTTVNKISVNPQLTVDDRQRVTFFVPLRLLNLEAGDRLVQAVVVMSDAQGRARFPEIFKADTPVEMPLVKQLLVQVQELQLAAKDAQTGAPYFGSHLPDMQWQLLVGKDVEFASSPVEGSLTAEPGEAKVKVGEKDEITLVIMDQGEEGSTPAVIDRIALSVPQDPAPLTIDMKDEGIIRRLQVIWVEVEKEKNPFDLGSGR